MGDNGAGRSALQPLMSYGAGYNQNWVTIIPEAHWKFFERTARYFETEDHIFVHACLDAEADMDDQPDWLLYWESVDRLKPHKSGKRIVCGHSPPTIRSSARFGFRRVHRHGCGKCCVVDMFGCHQRRLVANE
jgi:hypothetical protein